MQDSRVGETHPEAEVNWLKLQWDALLKKGMLFSLIAADPILSKQGGG